MARIGLDAVHISLSGKGISRFQASFVRALAARRSKHEFIVFIDDALPPDALPEAPHLHYVRVPKSSLLVWEQVQLPALARRYSIDIFQTYSDRIPFLYSKPVVMYTFEIPDYRHQAKRNASLYQVLSNKLSGRWFPYSLRKARKILVSSNATFNDLVCRYGISPDKIALAYPGVTKMFEQCPDSSRIQSIRERLNAPEGYVLHFSSDRDPRDNTRVALLAFQASIEKLQHRRKLVIGGNCNLASQGLADLVHDLKLSDRLIFPGFVPDSALVELYWGADVYLDPSLYEGFGFQVLEAMVCGAPVICSNVTSLPEIAGDAGILAGPNDVDSFCSALIQVLSDPGLARSMREKGIKRGALFSWDRTVDVAMNTYAECL